MSTAIYNKRLGPIALATIALLMASTRDCLADGSQGGGIYCIDSSPVIASNIIMLNRASLGGGIYCSSSQAVILNNTLIQNSSDQGAGIYCFNSSPAISNNIVAFNAQYEIANVGTGTPVLRSNDVYNGTDSTVLGVSIDSSNISLDPKFSDENAHISVESPCIGAGWVQAPSLPSIDIDDEPRVRVGAVDIGADENSVVARTISGAKLAINTEIVNITDSSTVSGTFNDCFYIQDQCQGIRVAGYPAGLSVGMKIHITGVVGTNSDGERYIQPSDVFPMGTGSLSVIGMNNKTLGGGDLFYRASPPERGQRGVDGGIGPNNIGILVRIWGIITAVGTDYLYVDDGSNLHDGTYTRTTPNVGVRIICNPNGHSVGEYVRAIGINSCLKMGSGALARKLLIRQDGDIYTYQLETRP